MKLQKRFGLAAAMEEIQEETAAAAEAAATAAAAAAAAAAVETAPEGDTTTVEENTTEVVEPTEVVPEPEVEEIPMSEDSLEEALGQTEVASNEIDAAEDTIDTAVSDADTLSAIADKMEAADETGGLDANGAAIAQVAIEHLMQRLQLSDARPMLAMESFGSSSSRQKATKLATENVREMIKGISEAIITMVKQAYEFIKNFIKWVADSNVRLKTRAEKMAKALDGIKGTAQSKTVEGAFVSKLVMGDKVDAAAALVAVNSLLEAGSELTTDFFNAVKPSDILDTVLKAELFNAFEFKGIGGDKLKESGMEAAEGFKSYALGMKLPGNSVVTVTMKKDAAAGKESLMALAKTAITVEAGDKAEVENAPVLDLDEAKKLVEAVIAQCDKMASLKEQSDAIEKYLSELVKELKSTATDLKDDEEATGRVNVVKSVLIAISKLATKPMVQTGKFGIATANATLDYVGTSGKAYGVAEVPAEKPAE